MVAPLLCGAVIPGVGVLTAALLHKLWSLGGQLEPAEPLPAAPLHWQLEPPFMLLGLIILLDIVHRVLCKFKVPSSHTILMCRPHDHGTDSLALLVAFAHEVVTTPLPHDLLSPAQGQGSRNVLTFLCTVSTPDRPHLAVLCSAAEPSVGTDHRGAMSSSGFAA